jgi:L-asparaginase
MGRRKRVYLIHTGGTIGMARTPDGYAPAPGFLETQMRRMPELADPSMPEFTIHELAPLLDSSNMTPQNWFQIAQEIHHRYDQYDGFLVLHGTDTMTYTSSALPFILRNTKKPIIVTGSQIPLCEIRSDGRENLITGLLLAAESEMPEVCLFFGNRVLRGCRAVKISARGFDAFDSPNYPPLGLAGIDIAIHRERLWRPDAGGTWLHDGRLDATSVGALRLFPGISARVLENMLMPPIQGLVLEIYGVGNGPDQNPEFLAVLKRATDRGVVVVNCTQCLRGAVSMSDYATGAALAKAGVISGHDMTTEAALAKLYTLLSSDLPPAEIKRRMARSLCGELTEPEPRPAPAHPGAPN